jgi:hypothetical protein
MLTISTGLISSSDRKTTSWASTKDEMARRTPSAAQKHKVTCCILTSASATKKGIQLDQFLQIYAQIIIRGIINYIPFWTTCVPNATLAVLIPHWFCFSLIAYTNLP